MGLIRVNRRDFAMFVSSSQKDLVISLKPQLKGEKRDGSSASDPYVAFRRRTEKMQTRKVNCPPEIFFTICLGNISFSYSLIIKKHLCFHRIGRMMKLHMKKCSNFEETLIELGRLSKVNSYIGVSILCEFV